MDAYFAGKEAQPGSPAHALYLWIETLHQRMDLLVAQFTSEDWEHDYSIESLKTLEEDLVELYGEDDGTHARALYLEALAGFVGEVLLEEGGGRWIWDEDAGSVGLPAIQPDAALGLEPIVPILLVGQAVYEKTQGIFATVALRLRKAVVERKAADPDWRPRRVRTPWVRYHELDHTGARWKRWPSERFHDYLTWWADEAGGGRERWDFRPASLDLVEELLHDRLGTVEAYDEVAGDPFWTVLAWYVAEYVVRSKGAAWEFSKSNPEAPPGTWYAEDSYWTDTIFVNQPMRYAGHAEHPTEMLRAVLRGERLRDVVDRFADPTEETEGYEPGHKAENAEPWPEILWPLVGPEHLPPPLTAEEREQLAEELREMEADPDLQEPDWHDNPRLHAYLAERRAAFPDWAASTGHTEDVWDFSPESLDRLEALLRARFTTYEQWQEAQDDPFVLGAVWYYGEVLVRNTDGRWALSPEPPEPGEAAHYDEPQVREPDRDEFDEDEYLALYGEDEDEEEWEYMAGSGYVCLPAGEFGGMLLRDDPEERLRDALDSFRKRIDRGGEGDEPLDAERPADTVTPDDREERTDGTREVRPKAGSRATLTLLFPPFPAPVGTGTTDHTDRLPAHDPERARRVVAELGTVEEILEQLPDQKALDLEFPEVRADLDVVTVGCWGNVVHVIEPALASDLLTDALTPEMERQRARHPEARVVGSVDMDYGNSYLLDVVLLPDGTELHAGGWDCDDDWDVIGDPEEVLRVLGVDHETAEEAGFVLDDEPSEREWSALGALALGSRYHPSGQAHLEVSRFRVRRTSSAAFDLDELWMGR